MIKINTNKKEINEVLLKGVERIFPNKEALENVLMSGRKIRVYCGYDPTSPSLHIGHAITLRKLAQFQKLGHEVIFLIGDFTARIGDPTDKTSARKRLTKQEVQKNLKDYKKQAEKILKFSGKNPVKIMFNSKWNDKLNFPELIELSSYFTVHQMLTRDMFQERIKEKKQIYLHEFLYPLIQAYDSVVMNIDVEVGGKDQTFNILCGRDLMKKLKNKEKFALTLKLLTDSSGKKMSKTEGNAVSLSDNSKEMFGKIMSWPDASMLSGFEMCTDLTIGEINKIEKDIKDKKINPKDAKIILAKEIVGVHWSKKDAKDAEKEFNLIFKEKKDPTIIPEIKINQDSLDILDLLVKTKLVLSKSEAKRMILQGGVKINSVLQKDWKKVVEIKKGTVVQVGKRNFVKIS